MQKKNKPKNSREGMLLLFFTTCMSPRRHTKKPVMSQSIENQNALRMVKDEIWFSKFQEPYWNA